VVRATKERLCPSFDYEDEEDDEEDATGRLVLPGHGKFVWRDK